jgi:diaminohydroxyphosphoribosylaminopyrimidine deaminase/5-amino-6-(5-phosphoribosylamino)uracil reductase
VQAVNLVDASWKQVGPDLMMTGYLPSSGGLLNLERSCSFRGNRAAAAAAAAAGSSGSNASSSSSGEAAAAAVLAGRNRAGGEQIINFYKAWDEWGALSNFSPHPITMPVGPVTSSSSSSSTVGASSSELRQWASVEHFYQSQKFTGVAHSEAAAVVEAIAAAESPEEAARIGRQNERQQPELLRSDWAEAKRAVMLSALRVKFDTYIGPRQMLLSTAADSAGVVAAAAGQPASSMAAAVVGHQPHQQQHFAQHSSAAAGISISSSSRAGSRSQNGWGQSPNGAAMLVEASPHDRYWGQGYDGLGQNHLGQLLMQVRSELLLKEQQEQQLLNQQQPQPQQHLQQQEQGQGQGQHTFLHHSSWQQQQGVSLTGSWQQQQRDARAGLAS